MPILTKAQLEALNQSSFPDNTTGAITPQILRTYNTQTIDTLVDSLDTGSFVTSAITGSSLITASFSGNTLTFTKGNGTQFGVVIPDVSGSTINTGSLMVTGSVVGNVLTFTKGDATQFTLTVATGSGGGTIATGSFATTGSNVFTGDQTIQSDGDKNGIFFISGSQFFVGQNEVGRFVISSSNQSRWFELNNDNGFAEVYAQTVNFNNNVNLRSRTEARTFVQEAGYPLVINGTLSASLQNGYAFVGGVDGYSKQVPTSSFAGAVPVGTATTGSNIFIGDQTITGSVNLSGGEHLFIKRSVTGGNNLLRLGATDNENNFAFIVTGSDVNPGQQVWGINTAGGTWGNSFDAGVVFNSYVTASAGLRIQSAGTFSAPLQQGYAWVGDSTGRTNQVPTSSFGGGGGSTFPYTGDAQITGSLGVSDTITINKSGGNGLVLTNSGISSAGTITTNNRLYVNNQYGGIDIQGNAQGSGSQYPGMGLKVAENTYPTDIFAGYSILTEAGAIAGTTFVGLAASTYTPQYGSTLIPCIIANGNNPAGNDTAIAWTSNGQADHWKKSNFKYGVDVTGSINSTGDLTLRDTIGNIATLTDVSGSFGITNGNIDSVFNVLGNAGANPNARLGGNLLFKNAVNQSGSLVISGSGNILTSMPTVTTGFRNQLSGNNIGGGTPSVSSSMAFPINVNSNIIQTSPTFRGPVSSSAYTLSNNYLVGSVTLGTSTANNFEKGIAGVTLSNNVINAAVSAIANTTNLTSAFSISNSNINQALTINAISSSVQIANSNMGGASATINNRAFHTGSNNYMVLASTLTSGQTTTINVDGASSTNVTPGVVASLIGGSQSNIQLGAVGVTSDSNQLRNTIVFGNNLTITGSNSSAASNTQGSAFVGRWNDVNVGKNDSSYAVFAVGTGTSTTRKTGFLIDSGSNTFIEGTLNISGSTSTTDTITITKSGGNGLSITGSGIYSQGTIVTAGSFNGSGNVNLTNSGGASVNLQSNSAGSGSAYTGVNVKVDNTTDPTNVYSALQLIDDRTGNIVGMAWNSYSSQYTSSVPMILANAQYNGSDTAFGFPTNEIDTWKPINFKAEATFTTGSNKQAGTATLDGGNPGTVTVSNSLVTANSIIMVSKQTLNHPNGYVAVSAKSAGSFTITSNHNGDADTVGWFIINNS